MLKLLNKKGVVKTKYQVVYPVLEKLIKERAILKNDIADLIGVTRQGLRKKLVGKNPFLLEEAKTMQKVYFKDISLEKLFYRKDE